MEGQMTLLYIILRHNQEQAQCYQINVNLFHCALKERKLGARGWSINLLPLYQGGGVAVRIVIRTI